MDFSVAQVVVAEGEGPVVSEDAVQLREDCLRLFEVVKSIVKKDDVDGFVGQAGLAVRIVSTWANPLREAIRLTASTASG